MSRISVLKQVWQWLGILLVLIFLPTASFSLNFNQRSVDGLARAYGFVLGQEYSLSRIENELPQLSGGVELARAQFGATFPDIQHKLETQLKQAMGKKQFQEIAANLRATVSDTFGRQQITKDIAVGFLDQVKARSKGDIESPVLEYLLAVTYAANPVGEFADWVPTALSNRWCRQISGH